MPNFLVTVVYEPHDYDHYDNFEFDYDDNYFGDFGSFDDYDSDFLDKISKFDPNMLKNAQMPTSNTLRLKVIKETRNQKVEFFIVK